MLHFDPKFFFISSHIQNVCKSNFFHLWKQNVPNKHYFLKQSVSMGFINNYSWPAVGGSENWKIAAPDWKESLEIRMETFVGRYYIATIIWALVCCDKVER